MATELYPLVSIEEYFDRYEDAKPALEYINGVLYPKAMGTRNHSEIQARLIVLLAGSGLRVYPELTVRLAETKVFIPDLVANPVRVASPYPAEPVFLCVEIVSPSQQGRPGKQPGELLAKCEQYHEWGVPFCWVIDPDRRAAYEYHATGFVERQQTDLHAGDLSIPLSDIFEILDQAD